MTKTVFTDDQVIKNFAKARKAAQAGPVVITTASKPSHVLMTFDAYRRLIADNRSIAERFHYPGAADISFEPAKAQILSKDIDHEP
ncbi:MAG: type II toxin-antitoxin system Phd/YefM family antitoxin [Thalassospira sp.]|uniref:type II toxin-antitoxin system Phd/YefM family antitoxin n=1 Tax=Thalassospira sp. TaxID=1912094 RepID=UPI0032EAA032